MLYRGLTATAETEPSVGSGEVGIIACVYMVDDWKYLNNDRATKNLYYKKGGLG